MRGSCAPLETQIEFVDDLPSDGVDFNALIEGFETRLINLALARTGGNKKAAARLLHLNRTTLVEKIKKKGLESQVEMIDDEPARVAI